MTSDGAYNYAGYLLSDSNGTSIKIAKYRGTSRVDLIENHELGYCCLVKAVKQVLDRLEVENTTFTRITCRERLQHRLLDATALREGVINAIVHNDYTNEIPPKFELFSDRIEITSAGSLPYGFTREEFLSGYSVPRNRELMRVFKDLELVESLGSGIPRILEKYDASVFIFTDNFLRIVYPYSEGYEVLNAAQPESGVQSGVKSKILFLLSTRELGKQEIAENFGKKSRTRYLNNLIKNMIDEKLIEYTIPEKPNSRMQKYRLTEAGKKNNFNFGTSGLFVENQQD